jgi:hypothetical protein
VHGELLLLLLPRSFEIERRRAPRFRLLGEVGGVSGPAAVGPLVSAASEPPLEA